MRIVQISDTHFGTERPAVVAGLAAEIARLAPDLVLLCGDITQRARRSQFEAAARFMRALPPAIHRIAVPGNHDLPLFNLWSRLLRPYAGYQRAFGARESLWSGAGVTVLALDATSRWRRKHGALPAEALARRLAEARQSGGEGLLVVAAHQPLWTAWGYDRRQTLRRRHRVAELLARARVDAVLSGHVHVPLIATSQISDPQLPWRFLLSGSGTAVSHRVRPLAPNSFNCLEFAPAGARISRHDWTGAVFALRESKDFRRGPGGWSEAAA